MDEMIKEGAIEGAEVTAVLEPEVEVAPEEVVAAAAIDDVPEAVEEKTEEQLLREAEEAEKARKAKIAQVWDKVTTGLLIALMTSPFLILLYIFIWFMAA